MSDIFTIKARRCKRCGRLLTSEKALKTGYGDACACSARKDEKEAEPLKGQMTMFDYEKQLMEGGMDGTEDKESTV